MNLKEKIISETIKLFSMKGFLSTSINDIMAASGTSKGGLYNHFKSKDDLFIVALDEARKLWRERCLSGLDQVEKPVEKVVKLFNNYVENYLYDNIHFPGGCIFIVLAVELADQRPDLAGEINKGFAGLQGLLRRYFDQAKENGDLKNGIDPAALTEIVFSNMIGASIIFGTEKSKDHLIKIFKSLKAYLRTISI